MNVNLSKKKPKKERLDNIGRIEINAQTPKKERPQRIPGKRRHSSIHSSKKKRKESYDSEGRPLTNTGRLNVDLSKKKEKKEWLDNFSKLEVGIDGSVKRSGSFDKEPRALYKPGKGYDTATKTKKTDRKYDLKTKPQTALIDSKYGKTQIKTTTTSQQRQPLSTSTYGTGKKPISQKLQQTPTSSARAVVGTSDKPYYTQSDYSKSNKYQSFTGKKEKDVDKSKPQGQKPGYVNQFNIGDKKYQTESKTKSTYGTSGTNDTYGTYGTGSQLHTAVTFGKKKPNERMTKSVERKIDLISGDTLKKVGGLYPTSSTKQKPYVQAPTTKTLQDISKIISSRYASAPKKSLPGTTKKGDKTPMQTPKQKQKQKMDETHKGSDVKIDLSKYYQKQTPQSKKPKDKKKTGTEPEIYEYYPMSSKTASKADTYNKNKPLTQQFKYDDIYEYNPTTKIYEYKPEKGDKTKKTITTTTTKSKRGGALSTEPKSKKDYSSVDKTKTTTTTTATGVKNLPSATVTLDKYGTGKIKKMKTPSFSVQKDRITTINVDTTKGAKDKNNRYLLSPFSDQRSTLHSSLRNSMAYFKCKFLTTKQVCEKFWKSIDSGELSSSMFDSNKVSARNSGTVSKLSNILSPEKNRYSYKNSFSNENTEYTAKNYGKIKGMINSNSDAYFKNLGDVRTSYKSGN